MSLEQTINQEIKSAMLAKQEAALRGLRAIKSAILLAKTADGKNGEISPDDEIKLLQKLAKQRRDSIEIFKAQQRDDLAGKENEELEIIEKFLPTQLSETELTLRIEQLVQESGASGPGDMGKVMGLATKQLAGLADGKLIASVVKSILNK